MPILYSTVARGTTVLAKYTDCVGNFPEVTGLVLNTIELRNNKCTYTNGPYAIHYICQDNIIYMCITEIVSGCRSLSSKVIKSTHPRLLSASGV